MLVFRETARNTDERTCIAAVLPPFSAASHKLSGLLIGGVCENKAAIVLNSFCFDFALRKRTAGTSVSFTYMRPMPISHAHLLAAVPDLNTVPAWESNLQHITENPATWSSLWESNRIVAEAYGLSADDFEHILDSFPVFARKRPEFLAYMKTRLAEWKTEGRGQSAARRTSPPMEALVDLPLAAEKQSTYRSDDPSRQD